MRPQSFVGGRSWRGWPALWGAVLAVAAVSGWGATWCCPFCGGVQQTLSDEIKGAEAAVIAELIGPVPASSAATKDAAPVPQGTSRSRFKITEILKGADVVGETKHIDVLYLGQETPGTPFLVQAARIDGLAWGTPMALGDRSVHYVRQLQSLPEAGGERLAFFSTYLEDDDALLRRDAYDEFAKAPYDDVKAAQKALDRAKLIGWIKDDSVITSHRRLYLTLLGIIARTDPTAEEFALLEESIMAEPEEVKPALDASIACYLTLKGLDGLPLIEERFLKNDKSPYADTYAAIMALRFHGQEEKIIPKERVVAAMRHLLDRPDLADLIIPDLARWEDWTAMDRLVQLFKNADDKSSWVRVPVIQYLRACPLPEAEQHIAELSKIDPDAIKRANFFVPIGGGNRTIPPAKNEAGKDLAGEAEEAGKTQGEAPKGRPTEPAAGAGTTKAKPRDQPAAAKDRKSDEKSEGAAIAPNDRGNDDDDDAATATVDLAKSRGQWSPVSVAALPLAAAGLLFAVMVLILRGGIRTPEVAG